MSEDAKTENGGLGYATYSPEDNKLRLYVGRVPREDYLRLREQGWTSTPKQGCDFVATWTPSRRDTALEYGGGVIEDEDQPMAERAADRAERFGGYREKRTQEALGHADRYDAGPVAHGYQSQARAERSAARHDRIAGRACDVWEKAEYWQRRTAGVIANALYKSRPDVRMGRIKIIEADLRRREESLRQVGANWRNWKKLSEIADPQQQTEMVRQYAGNTSSNYGFKHPRPETVSNSHIKENGSCLWTLMGMVERGYGTDDITGAEACSLWLAKHPNEPMPEKDSWAEHYRLRLAYENQMLESEGGRAALLEMVVGGWIGNRQIRKVNKSAVTGQVVSVEVMGKPRYGHSQKEVPVLLNIERLSAEVYREPTEADIEAMKQIKAAEKAARPEKTPCPLVNPTDADAERLQKLWNDRCSAKWQAYAKEKGPGAYVPPFKPSNVMRITQAKYSAHSGGTYSSAETRILCGDGQLADRESNLWTRQQQEREKRLGAAICKVRITSGEHYMAERVIILTDKPQKPFPAALWEKPEVFTLEAEKVTA